MMSRWLARTFSGPTELEDPEDVPPAPDWAPLRYLEAPGRAAMASGVRPSGGDHVEVPVEAE